MTNIFFAGNAVTARILYGYLAKDTRYHIVGCVVDDGFSGDSLVPQLQTWPLSEALAHFNPAECGCLMAAGYANVNCGRRDMFERIRELGYRMETYIHPQALIYTAEPIGVGSVIMPGALVEPGAVVGEDCFVWGNVVIAHDAHIGSHCWLAAGAVISGMAKVGESCFVGVNATIANKVEVGCGCLIGGAAFISKNVKPGSVMLARSAEAFRCTAQDYARYFGF